MSDKIVKFNVAKPGGRLDHILVRYMPSFSRSRLQHLIRDGMVTVNGKVETKTGYRLEGGEAVMLILQPPKPTALKPESIPLQIIFENKDILIVNKAAGMVVHPSAGHDSGTLVQAALAYIPDLQGVGGELRPGVIHRLDKDTSGLILLAKRDSALREIQEQFKQRQVHKVYIALTDGQPPTPTGRIETSIGRDPRNRKRMAVVPEGKGREAITIYRTLENFREHTLLEVKMKTGRTHQIRVHMAFLGSPIAGDRIYGRRRKVTIPLKHHFLHAARITLRLPGEEEPRTFEATLPEDLNRVLEWLRGDLTTLNE